MSNNHFYYLDGNNKLTKFNNDTDLTVKDLNCHGNVGIGTTTPHTDLHIIKDMHVFEDINTITMNTNIYGCNINIRANDNLSLSIDGSTGTANQLLVTDGSKLKWDSMKSEVDLITGNPSYMFITKNNVKYRMELKDEPVIVKPNINYVNEITEFSQTQTIHPNFINFKIDTPLNILGSNNDIVVKRKYNRLALNDVVQDIVILDNSKSYTFDLNNDSLYSFPFMVKQPSSYGSTDIYDGQLTISDYLIEGATTRNLTIPGNTLYGCYEYNTTVTNTNMGSYLNSINMDYVPTDGFVVKSDGNSVPIGKIVYDSSTMNFNINLQDGTRVFKDQVVSIEYTKAQGILDTFNYNTIINSSTTVPPILYASLPTYGDSQYSGILANAGVGQLYAIESVACPDYFFEDRNGAGQGHGYMLNDTQYLPSTGGYYTEQVQFAPIPDMTNVPDSFKYYMNSVGRLINVLTGQTIMAGIVHGNNHTKPMAVRLVYGTTDEFIIDGDSGNISANDAWGLLGVYDTEATEYYRPVLFNAGKYLAAPWQEENSACLWDQ